MSRVDVLDQNMIITIAVFPILFPFLFFFIFLLYAYKLQNIFLLLLLHNYKYLMTTSWDDRTVTQPIMWLALRQLYVDF